MTLGLAQELHALRNQLNVVTGRYQRLHRQLERLEAEMRAQEDYPGEGMIRSAERRYWANQIAALVKEHHG
jgi:hypothetical protein